MYRLALEQAVKGKEVFSSYLQVKLCVNFTHELYGCPFKGIDQWERDGLSVVLFDRSHFKLFSGKFSNKLVQGPSYKRHKIAPRTLFLLFANYNCFPITLYCRAVTSFIFIAIFGTSVKNQSRCLNYHVTCKFPRRFSDAIPLFGNNSWFQKMTETVFSE